MKTLVSRRWGKMERRSWLLVSMASVLVLSIFVIVNAAGASSSVGPVSGLPQPPGQGRISSLGAGPLVANPNGPYQETPTVTPTSTPCSPEVIQNGGFETGTLPPWVALGTNPPPVVSTDSPHSGTYSALLGTLTGSEPTGDSSIYQTITIPPDGGILSYWWNGNTTDTINYDWQDAYVTSTSGVILDTIMHNCSTTGGFVNVTYNLGQFRGQTIRIEFLVHQDGVGDDTSMYVDDVALLTSCPTSTPPANTNTPTPASTGVPSDTPAPAPTNPPSDTPAPVSTNPPSNTPTPASTPTQCSIQFSDVPPGYWAYGYIRCLFCRGVVNGYADGTFRPENNVTRAQIAKFLANAAGWMDDIPSTRQTFSDVPPNNPFWLYVERAYLHGAISGYADGTFHPYTYVTRAQIAKMDTIAAGYTDSIPASQQTFTDVPYTFWAWLYVERASAHGVIGGYACSGPGEPCPGRYFRPDNNATRAQISKFVYLTFYVGCVPLLKPSN